MMEMHRMLPCGVGVWYDYDEDNQMHGFARIIFTMVFFLLLKSMHELETCNII